MSNIKATVAQLQVDVLGQNSDLIATVFCSEINRIALLNAHPRRLGAVQEDWW